MITTVLTIFICIEFINVIILYFYPDSKYGNSVGIFKSWSYLKQNDELYSFARYMVYWVAGVKLIFIALLIVILIYGNNTIKLMSLFALILSISIFYWKMFPIIKRLDENKLIIPEGYSKSLNLMIGGIIFIFSFVLIYSIYT